MTIRAGRLETDAGVDGGARVDHNCDELGGSGDGQRLLFLAQAALAGPYIRLVAGYGNQVQCPEGAPKRDVFPFAGG